jgi:hypothetical protein
LSLIIFIEKDIPRSQLKTAEERKVLRNILYVYLSTRQKEYIQGYSFIGATCILAFKKNGKLPSRSEHLIYLEFSELMDKFFLNGFTDNFKNVGKLSTVCMEVIKREDIKLHQHICDSLGTMSIGVMLLPAFIVWLFCEFQDLIKPTELLSIWTFFLTFPRPNLANCCMIAAMILSKKESIFREVPNVPLIYFFNGRSEWNWAELKKKATGLYFAYIK